MVWKEGASKRKHVFFGEDQEAATRTEAAPGPGPGSSSAEGRRPHKRVKSELSYGKRSFLSPEERLQRRAQLLEERKGLPIWSARDKLVEQMRSSQVRPRATPCHTFVPPV